MQDDIYLTLLSAGGAGHSISNPTVRRWRRTSYRKPYCVQVVQDALSLTLLCAGGARRFGRGPGGAHLNHHCSQALNHKGGRQDMSLRYPGSLYLHYIIQL